MKYLSPTSIALFYSNPKEYYLQYLSPEKPDRIPQTSAMAAGSAFDAYVKSYLAERLFGPSRDAIFQLSNLFEAQVESHNRDQGLLVGRYLFEQYKKSGALIDLLTDMESAIGTPRLELAIQGAVDGYRQGITKSEAGGVVLLGKPDVIYINKEGYHVILDWKVNSFYSNTPCSPAKGYLRLRTPTGTLPNHPDAFPIMHKGMMINCATYLESVNKQWADQLAVYGWLAGCSVGEDFLVCIDQLVCDTRNPVGQYPSIKIAEHRLRISENYQHKVFAEAAHLWNIVHSDHFWRDQSLEESQAYCRQLDEIARQIKRDKTSSDPNDAWFSKVTR